MLKKLVFKNYRCFEDSEISLRNIAILVGNNNAGKSTVIEALRIIAYITQRFRTANYVSPPTSLGLPAINRGISLNLSSLKIDLRTVVFQYKEDTFAEIHAHFDDNTKIKAYLSSDIAFATIENNGLIVKRRLDAKQIGSIELNVMPQIGLIREDEPKLANDTIVRDIDTRLCSRHFRNELYLFKKDHYDTFVQIAQSTWPGLRINSLDYDTYENKLNLYVYDAEYSAEIGLMGSGLQMWLQMVWFISRCSPDSTIVLDEPDVYMHPDLQRKIYKIVTSRFKQVIIATHSVEIISAAEPYQIVTIDKTTRKMQYANNYKAVQSVIANLGSEHNLSLTRLGNAKKCVFVEGNDVKTLVRLQAIVDPQYQVPIDHVPSVSLGGWTRFNEALGAARLFYEETHGEIETYCILDHDYHTEEEIRNLYAKADESHLTLHIWSKKEIENYLITPESVFRLIGLEEDQRPEFLENFFKLTDQLYQSTLTATMDYLSSIDRSKTAGVIMKMAADILTPSWSTLEGRLSVVNGKELMSLVNSWLRNQHKVKSSRDKLIKALTPDDISQEIKDVINLLTK